MFFFFDRCESCAVGYYGNAKMGTSHDCKRCACPLLNDENNFSPTCQLRDTSYEEQNEVISDYSLISYQNNDYICTECPDGYTGDRCERYGFDKMSIFFRDVHFQNFTVVPTDTMVFPQKYHRNA